MGRRLVRARLLLLFVLILLGGSISAPTPAGLPGNALSWGGNAEGALGRPTRGAFNSTPGLISGLSNIIQVSAGGRHALALRSDGTVWAWGNNLEGQLGIGSKGEPQRSPEQVRSASGRPLSEIKQISAGGSHSLALTREGRIYAWGDDSFGQLGDGGQNAGRTVATLLSGVGDVVQISAGREHSLAIQSFTSGGEPPFKTTQALSWGSDEHGQLGRGIEVPAGQPGRVTNSTGFKAVSAGGRHSLAIAANDAPYSWGYNGYGQLGNGSTTNRDTPARVGEEINIRVRTIAGGGNHSLAILIAIGNDTRPEGRVLAWGMNVAGQLGDGTTTERRQPVPTRLEPKPTHIAAGAFHSLALQQGGPVYAWGSNRNGALGDGTSTNRATPVRVGSIRAEEISAGGEITVEEDCEDPCFSLAVATPPPTSRPKLRLDPPIGPPGFVTTVIGEGFPSDALVELIWNRGISAGIVVRAGRDGTFRQGLLILPRDFLGPRNLQATAFKVRTNFLVVPAQIQPRRFVTRS